MCANSSYFKPDRMFYIAKQVKFDGDFATGLIFPDRCIKFTGTAISGTQYFVEVQL